MEHAVSGNPTLLPWDPLVASTTEYPITTFQPTYFVANSLADACRKMRDFSDSLPKPFRARYNSLTGSIWVDRPVKQSGETTKL
jgi:phenylalanine-4-hydroxylase